MIIPTVTDPHRAVGLVSRIVEQLPPPGQKHGNQVWAGATTASVAS